jgi:enoyl-CoA hydratase/carnithine racemase
VHEDGEIITRREGEIFVIGLNRPAKYNGFTPKMLREMAAAYTAFEADEGARVALLYAEGKHFTAGLDLPKVAPLMGDNNLLVEPGQIDPCNNVPPYRSKPVVAAVQGITYTIGIELMLAADIVVAASDCRFSQLEVKRGIMATGGATIRMVERAGWGNAMRYLLTGDEFDCATALRFGFIQEVVEPGQQYAAAKAIAERIAAQPVAHSHDRTPSRSSQRPCPLQVPSRQVVSGTQVPPSSWLPAGQAHSAPSPDSTHRRSGGHGSGVQGSSVQPPAPSSWYPSAQASQVTPA